MFNPGRTLFRANPNQPWGVRGETRSDPDQHCADRYANCRNRRATLGGQDDACSSIRQRTASSLCHIGRSPVQATRRNRPHRLHARLQGGRDRRNPACAKPHPELKKTADEDPRPGRYLITGSAELFKGLISPESLAGRVETIALLPFSQAEIERAGRPAFLDRAFAGDYPSFAVTGTTPAMVERVVSRGLSFGPVPHLPRSTPERASCLCPLPRPA